jgi:hypothetical protein
MTMGRAIGRGIGQWLVVVGLGLFAIAGIAWSFGDSGDESTSSAVTSSTASGEVEAGSPEAVPVFVAEFSERVDDEDVTWLVDRLHPVVIAQHGTDLCRSFIQNEILLLENYRVTGSVTTGVEVFDGDGVQVTVDPYYTAPVAFDFQGTSYDGSGAFAPVDSVMHWFTECR